MSKSIKVTTKPTGAGAVAGKEILVDGIWKATVVERFVAGCVASIERDVNPPAETSAPLETGAPSAAPAATPRTDKRWAEEWEANLSSGGRSSPAQGMCDWAEELEREVADLRGKMEQAQKDAERYRWVLPILNDGHEGDERAFAIAAQLLKGLNGDAAIDAAKEASNG